VVATVVDHRTPWRRGRTREEQQALFWDRENWQPSCGPCHSHKTAKEDGGFGNAVQGNGRASQVGHGGEQILTGEARLTAPKSNARDAKTPGGGAQFTPSKGAG
jgi:hypothetical protein